MRKLRLSEELENAFDHRNLDRRQMELLLEQAEKYQRHAPPSWKPEVFKAYQAYFGFISALRAKAVVRELSQYRYDQVWGEDEVEIVDLGAGTLGASLGAIDALREMGRKVGQIHAVDQDPRPIEWAQEHFRDHLPRRVLRHRWPQSLEGHRARLVIASSVLTEVISATEVSTPPLLLWLEEQLKKASSKTVFAIMEPADFEFNQRFLEWRDRWRHLSHILLPCTHEKACPALAQKEWCHEERDYEAPSAFWNFVRDLGFRKKSLNFSLLVLGKQKPTFHPMDGRIVSSALKSKGRCDRWICADGQRWKESQLLRVKSHANEAFFESQRGDIVDLRILRAASKETRQ